jgi:hypothetical protein
MLKWNRYLLVSTVVFNLVLNISILSAFALEPVIIQERTEKIIVKIGGDRGGTGFFVRKNNGRYTILTNRHVIEKTDEYIISTSDEKSYHFDTSNIRFFPGVDLAEIEIKTTLNYPIAAFTTKSTLIRGSDIFTYGWNAVGDRLKSRNLQWLEGKVTGQSQTNNSSDGYTLGYTLNLLRGLSGSPLLDREGHVVGIYGSGEPNSIGLGIPIATYQNYTNTANIRPAAPSPPPIIENIPEDIQPERTENYSGQLISWKLDSNPNRLEFRTTGAVQPKAVMLFHPTRLIIDLPNINFSLPTITKALTGGYRSLRIGQFSSNTTRLSLEVEPGMTINPKRVKFVGENPTEWYVTIPDPEKETVIENLNVDK